jgi:hypothetical protein
VECSGILAIAEIKKKGEKQQNTAIVMVLGSARNHEAAATLHTNAGLPTGDPLRFLHTKTSSSQGGVSGQQPVLKALNMCLTGDPVQAWDFKYSDETNRHGKRERVTFQVDVRAWTV